MLAQCCSILYQRFVVSAARGPAQINVDTLVSTLTRRDRHQRDRLVTQ